MPGRSVGSYIGLLVLLAGAALMALIAVASRPKPPPES
jgi:hypothetical protein